MARRGKRGGKTRGLMEIAYPERRVTKLSPRGFYSYGIWGAGDRQRILIDRRGISQLDYQQGGEQGSGRYVFPLSKAPAWVESMKSFRAAGSIATVGSELETAST